MSGRRLSRRGPVTTPRIRGGTVALLAPIVLGVLGRSPWKALLLVPAFTLSHALGLGALPSEMLPLDPLSPADPLVVAIVWIVALGCAVTGLALERRRIPSLPDR